MVVHDRSMKRTSLEDGCFKGQRKYFIILNDSVGQMSDVFGRLVKLSERTC